MSGLVTACRSVAGASIKHTGAFTAWESALLTTQDLCSWQLHHFKRCVSWQGVGAALPKAKLLLVHSVWGVRVLLVCPVVLHVLLHVGGMLYCTCGGCCSCALLQHTPPLSTALIITLASTRACCLLRCPCKPPTCHPHNASQTWTVHKSLRLTQTVHGIVDTPVQV